MLSNPRLPQNRRHEQSLTEMERLRINSTRFVVESAIALAETAKSHRVTGNCRAAASALQGASRMLARAELRILELRQPSTQVEHLRARLLDLKRKLQQFECAEGDGDRKGFPRDRQ